MNIFSESPKFCVKNKNKGFTLIELLVVISIIALLSSVVLASLQTARMKARDARRLSDLNQIRNALFLWQGKYGDMSMENSGCGAGTDGDGYGWFNVAYDHKSIAQCLVDEGFTPTLIQDSKNSGPQRYLMTECGGATYLLVGLESKPANTTNAITCTGYETSYGINHWIEIR